MKKTILFFMLFCAIKSNGQTVWTPNPKYIKTAKKDTSAAPKNIYQCFGTTGKGERCKRKVNTDKGYCYQHLKQQQ